MKVTLLNYLLKHPIANRAPDVIPRSGPKGKAVRGYLMYYRQSDDDRGVLIDALESNSLTGREWDTTVYVTDVSLPLKDIGYSELKIDHYYGLRVFQYKNVWSYIAFGFTGLHVAGAKLSLFRQHIFNSIPLHREERMKVLQRIVKEHLENTDFRVSSTSLMTLIHTAKWAEHPSRDIERSYNQLVLESLEATGDLEAADIGCFIVKGNSLKTISDFEETEKRHKDIIVHARAMKLLTLALVFVGIIQVVLAFINAK